MVHRALCVFAALHCGSVFGQDSDQEMDAVSLLQKSKPSPFSIEWDAHVTDTADLEHPPLPGDIMASNGSSLMDVTDHSLSNTRSAFRFFLYDRDSERCMRA